MGEGGGAAWGRNYPYPVGGAATNSSLRGDIHWTKKLSKYSLKKRTHPRKEDPSASTLGTGLPSRHRVNERHRLANRGVSRASREGFSWGGQETIKGSQVTGDGIGCYDSPNIGYAYLLTEIGTKRR